MDNSSKKIRADLLLIGAFLLIGLILMAVLFLNRDQGAYAEISVGGKVIEQLPLKKDCTYIIESKNGGHNDLVIQDGEAWLTDATCPDGICIHMGKISHNNESIICLPNEVVIWVVDENESNGASQLDATAGGQQ